MSHRTIVSLRNFLLAFMVVLVLLTAVRTVLFGVLVIEGNGLEPLLLDGDRVVVNRWSYGLRVGGSGSVFGYGRLGRGKVSRGDIVAVNSPAAQSDILLCRCLALPGDTLLRSGAMVIVPSVEACADADYYWVEAIGRGTDAQGSQGFVAEENIIGRAIWVLYSTATDSSLFKAWRGDRFLIDIE